MRNSIESLPQHLRAELDRRSKNGAAAKELVDWLALEGHPIGYQPLQRFVKRVRTQMANVEAQADYAVAIGKAADAHGVDLKETLLDMAKTKLMSGLQNMNDAFWVDMKPSEVFNAIARISAVDIQSQRWQSEVRARMDAEMKLMEGDPDISLDTLKQVRERIYGIFDHASN